jgi:hypothetical protein
MTTPEADSLLSLANELLALADLRTDPTAVRALAGGRNNRVFRVETRDDASFLLKLYYHHSSDPRDRLGQECAFLSYLQESRSDYAPRLLATFRPAHAALLEFIEGTRLTTADVQESDIDQAGEFFRQANAGNHTTAALALPNASEACFSIAEHLERTGCRVARLAALPAQDDIDADAARFVADEMTPLWLEVQASIKAQWPDAETRAATLPHAERCLSPSDFGYHNALREPSGRLRFVDFEYAGWDDPAKLICDFANQPDLPLPRALSHRFRDTVLSLSRNPALLQQRAEALEPLYQIKWACICLNIFLSTGRTRDHFTEGGVNDDRPRRLLQLQRAREMLARAAQPALHR